MGGLVSNLLERLDTARPSANKKAGAQISPAQQLLDFLQRWPRDTICIRQIQQFGPRAVRATRQGMINSAEALVF
jgi:hypothetical protein